MPNSNMSIYPTRNKAPFWIVCAVAVLGTGLVLVTVYAAHYSLCEKDAFYLYIAVAVWAIGPPLWFWMEYFGVYMRWGKPEAFDLFKYGQQVATGIWAGVLATLLAFAASGASDPTKNVFSLERCQALCGADRCLIVDGRVGAGE